MMDPERLKPWMMNKAAVKNEEMNLDDSEEGLARGEDGSAPHESNDVQSSSTVPADTYSQLNRADDRPESPSCAAYAVVPAQPMTYAASAGYEDVNAPDGKQSSAKSARQDTPSPPGSWQPSRNRS